MPLVMKEYQYYVQILVSLQIQDASQVQAVP